MSHIGITPEMHAMAVELANLGREAERVCTGFTTETAARRVIASLRSYKGKALTLERALKARLASDAAATKEAARLAAAQHSNRAPAKLEGAALARAFA